MTTTVLPAAVSEYLSRRSLPRANVSALSGDASDRRYFRVAGAGGPSFVLAVHAQPFEYGALPFVNVAELFAAMSVPVPRVLDHAADLGILALTDLGDVTLQSRLAAASDTERANRYREAVGLIDVMQRQGHALTDPRFTPYGIAFDVDKLMWELRFFVRHFLEGHRGQTIDAESRAVLDEEFQALAGELAAEPRVVCHRDYHSRNLMVHDDRLYVIDFQDARLGPDTYDLASLLRDSYVELPQSLVDDLVREFAARRGADAAVFTRRFDAMSLQRNLKALGTFGFQASERGNDVYLQYVPRTLAYVRRNLRTYDRFGRLACELGRYVPELGAP